MPEPTVSQPETITVSEQPVAAPLLEREAVWPHHAVLGLFTLLWGSNFVLAEVALREMTPITFSVARFLMGGVGMVLLFYGQRRSHGCDPRWIILPRIRRSEWPRLLVVSLFGATLAPWLGIEGLGLTHAGRAAFWLALAPIVSALFGGWLHTERLNGLGRFGILLAGLGTAGLAMDGMWANASYRLGDLYLFAALILSVSELHLIKPLANRYGAIPIVTARTIIGGIFYMFIAAPSVARQGWLNLGFWTWVAILLGGTVGVGVGQWVKTRALRAIGPTQIVIYGNLVPLATLLIGWATIGMDSSTLEIAAGLLIVLGAFCLQRGGTPLANVDTPVA
ncbi:MAG TPA: DMT family transporter [Rhodothermales bacterium]|nr:DMT family transporter [Rhodothermales bacterium]